MGEPRPLAARRRLRKCGSPTCPWCSGAALRAVHGCGTLVRRSQAADEELLRRQRLRYPAYTSDDVASGSAQNTLSRRSKSLKSTVSFH